MAITLNTTQAMIERARAHATGRMVAVIGADAGLYRNVWPPATADVIKQLQESAWTHTVRPVPAKAGVDARTLTNANRRTRAPDRSRRHIPRR